jgi:hypothetical protein
MVILLLVTLQYRNVLVSVVVISTALAPKTLTNDSLLQKSLWQEPLHA